MQKIFSVMKILNLNVKIWALPVVKMQKKLFLDYTETINNEIIADKEVSAEDTLNRSDFPSDEEIVKNICDVHGSCGEDYKKESSESEAASEE